MYCSTPFCQVLTVLIGRLNLLAQRNMDILASLIFK